jgi:endonuclease/exonuclease/phosphatase family metal-dependent hydrolase
VTSPDQDDVLTVLTLNIWGDHLWEERKHALVDWFTEIRPDVVALQEATRSPELCEATWLAEQTGMDAVYAAAYVRSDRSDFGNAVLSRWPIVDSRSLQLTLAGASNIEPRGALTVDVRVRNRLVSVTSTHLSYRFDEGWVREAQVRQLVDFVGLALAISPRLSVATSMPARHLTRCYSSAACMHWTVTVFSCSTPSRWPILMSLASPGTTPIRTRRRTRHRISASTTSS